MSEIYDLLVEFENVIVGEQIIPINHCLLGVPGAALSDIRKVYSHPQSLMQTEQFLSTHPDWEQIKMQNNAFAARKVSEGPIMRAFTDSMPSKSWRAFRWRRPLPANMQRSVTDSQFCSAVFISAVIMQPALS